MKVLRKQEIETANIQVGDQVIIPLAEIGEFSATAHKVTDEGIMFTGDVIFAGSIGRTDLPGGNLRLLKQGIEKKVLNQPATTMIFPGHGPYTTVKNELLTNPFIS